MRIQIDFDRCEGHGLCAYEAPLVFDLDDYGDLVVTNDHPAEDLRLAVESARSRCPTGAISIAE